MVAHNLHSVRGILGRTTWRGQRDAYVKRGRRNFIFYQSCLSALLAFWKVQLLKEKSNSTYFIARLNSRIASYLRVSRSLQVIIGSVQLCRTALARMPKAREQCVPGRASAPTGGGHWMKTISLERLGQFRQHSWHKICSSSPAVFSFNRTPILLPAHRCLELLLRDEEMISFSASGALLAGHCWSRCLLCYEHNRCNERCVTRGHIRHAFVLRFGNCWGSPGVR